MEWQTQALQLRCWHRVSSLLGLIVVSWQATGGGVSSYFQTLFICLKASSSASEVQVQLTVGLTPQYCVLTGYEPSSPVLSQRENTPIRQLLNYHPYSPSSPT